MTTLSDLTAFSNTLLQPELFKDYCPNGLQVEGKQNIGSIATAVSASLETIEKAVQANVDALICHHGMFWKGDPYPIEGTKKRKLELLMNAGISLLAYHLPLDAHQAVGNNWRAARDMEWSDCRAFGEFNGTQIGVQGSVVECSAAEMLKQLERYYGHPAHHAPGGTHPIRNIALISGGAHKAIEEAARAGADAFITGSFDEPIWHLAKEEGIHFFAMGHAATERVGPRALGEHLEAELAIKHTFIEVENPF